MHTDNYYFCRCLIYKHCNKLSKKKCIIYVTTLLKEKCYRISSISIMYNCKNKEYNTKLLSSISSNKLSIVKIFVLKYTSTS